MLKIVWTLTPLFSLWKVKYIQLASINSIAKWTIVLAWHSIKSSILPPFACNLLFMHDLFAFSNLSLLKCPVWGSNSRPSDYETDALPTALTRLISFETLDGCVIASREKMKTVNCLKSLCFLHNEGKLWFVIAKLGKVCQKWAHNASLAQ